MPVIHTAHDPEELGLGFLLAHWSGELKPEDCLSITPDDTMAAAAKAQGCKLELRVPEFLKEELEFEVIDLQALVVMPGLRTTLDASHGTASWVPPITTEFRWSCDTKEGTVDLVLRMSIDNNQRHSTKIMRDGDKSLPAPDFGGPIVTVSWFGKPKRG